MRNEHDSLTSGHKITLDVLFYGVNQNQFYTFRKKILKKKKFFFLIFHLLVEISEN